jgi:hypothetical protein
MQQETIFENSFTFTRKADADKFRSRARRNGILLIETTANTLQVYNFEALKEDRKEWVKQVLKRAFEEITSR